jgi:hypothetical protein
MNQSIDRNNLLLVMCPYISMGHKQREALSWRRSKVHELLIQGLSQYEIAEILKVSQPTINNDVQFLREKARENMQNHIQNVLPAEYENCMAGINRILKMSWQIANSGPDNNFSVNSNCNAIASKIDDKIRLQALALASDCYKYKMDLITNGVVLTDAIKFIRQKKELLVTTSDVRTDTLEEFPIGRIASTQKNNINKVF